MNDRERAEDYIGIFVGAGERWRIYVPVDGTPTKRGVRIGSCEVWPSISEPGVWCLDDGADVHRYRAKESS
jgi:hypothetical protein